MMSLVELLILIPIAGAIAILLGGPGRFMASLVTLANLVVATLIMVGFDYQTGGDTLQYVASRPVVNWPPIALATGVDGLSLILLVLTVVVSLAAVFMSPPQEVRGQSKLYWTSILLIAAGAMGAFVSTDLFFFFAFHELALIPTFLMIGKLGHGEDRVDVAWRTTIYLGLGSLVVLVGLLGIVEALGGETFDIPTLVDLGRQGIIETETQKTLFLILLIGFGALVSLFPFHSWAAPAYAAAPAPVAMLHAGVLKKFGIYGLLRIAMPILPEGMEHWQHLLMVLLLGNILYIGLITISQDRLDRLLGYASVMHMGYLFLGIVSGSALGINGVVLLMFAHGISTALMFGLCGEMRCAYPTLDMRFIGGQGAETPRLCFYFLIAAFASIGLPGFANFASELLVFLGGFHRYEGGQFTWLEWTTILALWGVVISAVYLLRAVRKVFHGENPGDTKLRELTFRATIPAVILIAILLALGFKPGLLLELIPETLYSSVAKS